MIAGITFVSTTYAAIIVTLLNCFDLDSSPSLLDGGTCYHCSFLVNADRVPIRLAKEGRNIEALAVIAALEGKPHDDPSVRQTYLGIREAVAVESHSGSERSPLREIFTGGRSQNFRRAFLGVVNQCFQQITGINLIT